MATLKDIAKATGVSMITVSRVINHPESVNEKTRIKVQKEIARVNYHPNVLAKALVKNQSNIIYVYVSQFNYIKSPFFLAVVTGIGEALGEKGYSMLVKTSWYNEETCDGCILMGFSNEEVERVKALAKRKPVCILGSLDNINSVSINNYDGMKSLTNQVLSKGKKKIAYLTLKYNSPFVSERYEGFKDAIKESHKKVKVDYLYAEQESNSAYLTIKEYISKGKHPDVIMCTTDQLALGTLRALRERGIDVPGDIGVTGFDGFGLQDLTYPKLTTVHIPIYEAGKALADKIIALIEHKNTLPFTNTLMETFILERESL
jgi:DNA-binding LacI/PurR family transcriptional regulator